jgi:plastocyanin
MSYRALVFFCLVAFLAACQKQPTNTGTGYPASSPKIAAPTDPATAGQISGTVYFKGAPPKLAAIDMTADPGCRGSHQSETLVVHDGRLQNVFVYVNGSFTLAPPGNSLVVEQRACQYVPHVVAVAAGQSVEFRNTDPTIHNIHGMPQANDAWNASQPAQAPPMTRTFQHAETMIPVKCNQHPWMKMYINVADSPFFAVTNPQGHFDIGNLPPGTYDLVFVHETLGSQTHSITVGPKERKVIDVSFER